MKWKYVSERKRYQPAGCSLKKSGLQPSVNIRSQQLFPICLLKRLNQYTLSRLNWPSLYYNEIFFEHTVAERWYILPFFEKVSIKMCFLPKKFYNVCISLWLCLLTNKQCFASFDAQI